MNLKVSVDIDVDRINMAGMTALHQVGKETNIHNCKNRKTQHFWPKKLHQNAHTFLIHGPDQHGGDDHILHLVEKQSGKEATKQKHEKEKANFHLN